MLKMIVYIISQKPGKYKTNFIKPSQRKTDILYREFGAKLQKMIEILDFCFVKSPKKQHFYDIKHFFFRQNIQEEYRQAMAFKGDIAVIHLGINDTDPRNWPNYRDESIRER